MSEAPIIDAVRTPHPHASGATRWRRKIASISVAAVLATGCGFGAESANDSRPGREVDWNSRTVSLDAPAGWTVAFCEGDAPLLCVQRDGEPAGGVELLEFDAPELPLEAWAAEHHDFMAADRSMGCGDEYVVVPDVVQPATVAGIAGIRASFTGYMGDGRPAERNVTYAVVIDEALFLIVANAYEPDGCVGTEGGEFTVEGLRAVEKTLADIAIGSVLPGIDRLDEG